MPAWEMKRTVNEFTKIQRRAAILISGAFKFTSAAALKRRAVYNTNPPPYRPDYSGNSNPNPNRGYVGVARVSTSKAIPAEIKKGGGGLSKPLGGTKIVFWTRKEACRNHVKRLF
jgi:hypothetical protein